MSLSIDVEFIFIPIPQSYDTLAITPMKSPPAFNGFERCVLQCGVAREGFWTLANVSQQFIHN
jgi:hypothetical protein